MFRRRKVFKGYLNISSRKCGLLEKPEYKGLDPKLPSYRQLEVTCLSLLLFLWMKTKSE